MKKKPKQQSGGSRLAAKGRKPMLLALTPEEHATIFAAAESERQPATQFTIKHALAAAEKILQKKGKST